ncbi:MAG: hypothetical protein B7C24_00455 [Bacteroidetes bacterium 4572_77]|nr:MAG: hypothetical protein B7C24_00455 [Bacteroidetes bacterium 4572_77]
MSPSEKNTANEKKEIFIFGKTNYKFLLIGLGLILLGFILMVGGGSESPDVFNEGIFNFQRLTLAPILILAGFGVEIYAIMKKNK